MASLTAKSIYIQLAADNVDFKDTEHALRGGVKLEQVRRERQRVRTVNYRRKKKATTADLAQERQRLEEELKAKFAALTAAAQHLAVASQRPVDAALRQLSPERVYLARQNLALHEELVRYRSLQRDLQDCDEFSLQLYEPEQPSSPTSIAHGAATSWAEFQLKLHRFEYILRGVSEAVEDDVLLPAVKTIPQSVYETSKTSRVALHTKLSGSGCRVYFPNGEPHVYFHPFTRAEFDVVVDRAWNFPVEGTPVVGHIFGWTVHCAAPPTKDFACVSFRTQMQFSLLDDEIRCI